MPKLTIYVSASLLSKLKQHKGLNKSEIAGRALNRTILSGSCTCASCKEKERRFRLCQQLTSSAIKEGVLSPKQCEICHRFEVHAHHPDYNQPFEVRWLCPGHHLTEHNEMQKRPVYDVNVNYAGKENVM